jgi:hypothetical protein
MNALASFIRPLQVMAVLDCHVVKRPVTVSTWFITEAGTIID